MSSPISVEPNPATDGGEVTLTGEPGSTLTVVWGSKKDQRYDVKLDKRGKAKIPVPNVPVTPEGREFSVLDLLPPYGEVVVDVVDASKK